MAGKTVIRRDQGRIMRRSGASATPLSGISERIAQLDHRCRVGCRVNETSTLPADAASSALRAVAGLAYHAAWPGIEQD
jgi:hypothetical protein